MKALTFEQLLVTLAECCKEVQAYERINDAYYFLMFEGLTLCELPMKTDNEQFVARYLRYKPGARGNHFDEVKRALYRNLQSRRDEVKEVLSETDWVEIGTLLRDNRRFPKDWKKDARYPASALCLLMTRLELHTANRDQQAVLSDILDMIPLSLAISQDAEKQYAPAVLDKADSLEDAAYLLFWYEQGLKQTQDMLPLFDEIAAIYRKYENRILPVLQKVYRQAGIRPLPNLFFLTELYIQRAEYWLDSEDVFAVQQGIEQYRLIELLYCRKSPNYILYCRSRRLYGYQRYKMLIDAGQTDIYPLSKLLSDADAVLRLPLPEGKLSALELSEYEGIVQRTEEWLAVQKQ